MRAAGLAWGGGVTTNRQKVLDLLAISGQPLDDDQITRRAGITPRQTVNQICRRLEQEGLIRRLDGPDGKIVNELIGAGVEQPILVAPDEVDVPPEDLGPQNDAAPQIAGSSREQREAEPVMLALLGARLGLTLAPATLRLPSGARVEVDGADPGRTVLVECWAHQGPPKAAQKHKVLADALKLTWIATTIYPRPRLYLCLSDPRAAAPFGQGSLSWASQALRDLAVSVEVVDLPADVRASIEQAQARQVR